MSLLVPAVPEVIPGLVLSKSPGRAFVYVVVKLLVGTTARANPGDKDQPRRIVHQVDDAIVTNAQTPVASIAQPLAARRSGIVCQLTQGFSDAGFHRRR